MVGLKVEGGLPYVCCGVLLLCSCDGSRALSGIEGAFATDGRLALRLARAAHFAADFGDGVPVVRHVNGGEGGVVGGVE